ncbi:beta-ketoacyl reductase, partial [Kitasatospora sp. NPDC101176]|uniref:acyl carrier protein n=1 Tax=Kitasatospora sp. NPDC101176 TaxID=3364099 RepID=UPI0038026CCB
HALGLPATSLAWGLWEDDGMGSRLGTADLARMARSGIAPLSVAEGLALFDAALTSDEPLLVPARLDLGALRAAGDRERVPALLRGLVGPPAAARPIAAATAAPTADATPPWVRKLAEAAGPERARIALDLVGAAVAEVLGHPANRPVPAERGLLDLGLDSLTAVELRNRLSAETGLRLPTTLLFDHPTASALAAHLHGELAVRLPGGAGALLGHLDDLEAALAAAPDDEETRERLAARLTAVLARLAPEAPTRLDLADDDELFQLIEDELGGAE